MFKHQANCYRNIKGVKYINYADLVMNDEENERVENKIRAEHGLVKKIKHHSGEYYQLFVAQEY